jgi:hypothetical protein
MALTQAITRLRSSGNNSDELSERRRIQMGFRGSRVQIPPSRFRPRRAGANRFAGLSPTPLALLAAFGQIPPDSPRALPAQTVSPGFRQRRSLCSRLLVKSLPDWRGPAGQTFRRHEDAIVTCDIGVVFYLTSRMADTNRECLPGRRRGVAWLGLRDVK